MCLVLCLSACDSRDSAVQLAGHTMGTSWHVTYLDPPREVSKEQVLEGIESTLARVNDSMSNYLPESEISLFNNLAVGVEFAASADFIRVLSTALEIGRRSEGAYDVTVAPLVELWGFGAGGAVTVAPDESAIQAMLEQVGQDALQLDKAQQILSKRSPLSLDVSSLAKGYAVDQVARWLMELGIERFLVEVGGEMRLAGLSRRGDPWRVAIEQPDSAGRSVATAISLSDAAVATSGDYRNYFEVDGQRFSHSIDPRTGYPVAHDLVSVTVVHPSAMQADAWATALTVLGGRRAMVVARAQGLAVYFIRRAGEGFEHSSTPAFSAYLEGPGP